MCIRVVNIDTPTCLNLQVGQIFYATPDTTSVDDDEDSMEGADFDNFITGREHLRIFIILN